MRIARALFALVLGIGILGAWLGQRVNPSRETRNDLNVRAEYAVVGQFIHGTSLLRFYTLTAYFAFNGALLAGFLSKNPDSRWTWVLLGCAVVGNLLFIFLEWRTIEGHTSLFRRGANLETFLGIDHGTMTTTTSRRWLPFGHGIVLIGLYSLTTVVWIVGLVYALCIQRQ